MNFAQRLGSLDSRIIYALLVVVLFVPLLRPLGLPLNITDNTKQMYDVIDTLKEGDTVHIHLAYLIQASAEVEPQATAVLQHLFDKGVKVIFAGVNVDCGTNAEKLTKVHEEAGKVYGVDFINLGMLAGQENAIATYSKDFKAAYPRCHRGLPTENQPIMQGITSVADLDLVLFFTAGSADIYVRQFSQYGVPLAGGLIAASSLAALPFLQSGQLAAILVALRGGAEYELLINKPGQACASMDAQSMGHVLFIILIAVANLSYFLTRKDAAEGVTR